MVRDICDWGPRGYRGAVRVCWENKKRTVEQYRVGGDGEVDLTAVKPADGPTYYPDHLPYVGLCILTFFLHFFFSFFKTSFVFFFYLLGFLRCCTVVVGLFITIMLKSELRINDILPKKKKILKTAHTCTMGDIISKIVL